MKQETQEFGGGQSARSWVSALGRGVRKTCPRCGEGRLFSGYTTSVSECSVCGQDLSGHEADDAPPYVTIMIVGHITIPLALAAKQLFDPPIWLQFAVWTPVLAIASLWLLPVAKGALIALQWANRMHGFDEDAPRQAETGENGLTSGGA